MTSSDIRRVRIDCPSTLQPHHDIHGKRGIAVINSFSHTTSTVYFVHGQVRSMIIKNMYLVDV